MRKLSKNMSQRTPLLGFDTWTLIPREDIDAFSHCYNIRFAQSVKQKHNRCRFEIFPHMRFLKTNFKLETKVFAKFGVWWKNRFFVQT